MTHELIAIALGVLAGTLSALFGVGGGIIFVPTLIFLGHSAHVAVATSLAAMVPVIAVGAWRQTRYGSVNWHDALIIGVASVPMTKVGEIVADVARERHAAAGVRPAARAGRRPARAARPSPTRR